MKTFNKIQKIGIIISIIVILSSLACVWFYVLNDDYNRIHNGDAESKIVSFLGEPENIHIYNLTNSMMGPQPDIPLNMTYKQLAFINGEEIVYVWLISPDNYEAITNDSINTTEWCVIGKFRDTTNNVYSP